MREVFFLLAAFLHDLATGFWLASFLLFRAVRNRGLEATFVKAFFPKVLLVSLIASFLTGIPRWVEVRESPPPPITRKFLLLKHALLLPLLLGGTLWIWLATRT